MDPQIFAWLYAAVVAALVGMAEGCYRRATQRVTTAAPTMLPEITTTPSSQRLECTEEEKFDTACLRGTCFASVGIGNQRIPGCSCPEEYVGSRCQNRYIPPFPIVDGDHVRRAQLAGSITVVVLILFAIILALYVWHRIRKTSRSAQATNGGDRLLENGQHTTETRESTPRNSKCIEVHNGDFRKSGVTEVHEKDETLPLKDIQTSPHSRPDVTQSSTISSS